MVNKKKQVEPAKRNVRKPDSERPNKAAKFVPATFSFHPDQLTWIKATTKELEKLGYPKPNLSMVVQEAVLRMQEAFDGKSASYLMTDILTRRRARVARRELPPRDE